MPLDIVALNFLNVSTAAVVRHFVDMPVNPGKICLIRHVDFLIFEADRIRTSYDVFWAMSVDPDDDAAEGLIAPDSRKFLSGTYNDLEATNVGFEIWTNQKRYDFPEGIKCPFTRLPFFIQHSNNSANPANYQVRVLYELVKATPQEIAVAVLRRGRAVTRD